ncbi:MAG: DUF1156 domain-containing protein [Verrucomicrobia subdivision 3 bacterium]|nr:DUF1156 domain-containing protein [Limisphaerales bacterium]
MIERDFDVPFVAELALREKQIQQNYRPVIAVHKWFARRPGTLFRAVLLSEFTHEPLRQTFYQGHSFPQIRVLDPFMGGGTTLIEANRTGCGVTGLDVNPMSWWIVRQELGALDVAAYVGAANRLRDELEQEVGDLYRTQCKLCHSSDAKVKYFLWVKTVQCTRCEQRIDLFPNYMLSEDVRHPTNVFVCRKCGELYDSKSRKQPKSCSHCGGEFSTEFTARHNRVKCCHCGVSNSYPSGIAPRHRLFAIEYYCEECFSKTPGRLFKKPDADDIEKYHQAERRLAKAKIRHVPDEEIPAGDETERLHRWGYHYYRELFNARQLLGLELSCRAIRIVRDRSLQEALATNLSDLLRYQNMHCRYDTMALKSMDIFSVHGFPVSLIQCESNLLGVSSPRKSGPIGSGGWLNIVGKFAKAKRYCEHPFEVQQTGHRKKEIPIESEWIGEHRNGNSEAAVREVRLRCEDAAKARFNGDSFDAVLTDPPYFGNVQYAELMDFCYVWLRGLVGQSHPEFTKGSTRHINELTGNISMGRDLEHFAEGLSDAFKRAATVLKRGGPFVFTFHHNNMEAYVPVAVAILDASLVCSASLPCPAEMGASIHINGTTSSIVDTVFVCRATGRFPRRWLAMNAKELADLIHDDASKLVEAGLGPTQGDLRCITYGHLVRLAVWNLKAKWSVKHCISERLKLVMSWIEKFGGPAAVLNELGEKFTRASRNQCWELSESAVKYGKGTDEVAF